LACISSSPVFNFWSFFMTARFAATALVVPFEDLRMTDVDSVGGKNASLGEMISNLPTGVKVPTGFATTAHAFREFLAFDGLTEKINARLSTLDTEDVNALAVAGAEIRAMIESQPFPADLEQEIRKALWRCMVAMTKLLLPCARRPQPKTCPMRLLPASRKPF
jgi:phosphoenolpyruvate synthase/pyruvate phosphate dikinase